MVEFDYSKLRGRIVEKYGTLGAFAQVAGITEVALSRKMNNKMSITRDDMIRWSELLDISLDDYGVFYFVRKLNEA